MAALRQVVEESIRAHERLLEESLPVLEQVAQILTRTLRCGGKILFCGNGGSAADAQHVAAELVGRFRLDSDPWPAIALTTDSSVLTCVGNDWDFAEVFSRQVTALARPGDVVVGISTSGTSENVVRALRAAHRAGATRIGFTGSRGLGALARDCDVCFGAPDPTTARIQELHVLAWHAICEIVEETLTKDAA